MNCDLIHIVPFDIGVQLNEHEVCSRFIKELEEDLKLEVLPEQKVCCVIHVSDRLDCYVLGSGVCVKHNFYY